MKKLLVVGTCMALVFCLSGCGGVVDLLYSFSDITPPERDNTGKYWTNDEN